jgi:hypothetical protein
LPRLGGVKQSSTRFTLAHSLIVMATEKPYLASGELLLSSHAGVTSDGKTIKLPKATACWVALS